MPGAQSAADGNLLFGILALQMDFIGKDDLIAAMNAWLLDKNKPLGMILCTQGALQADDRALLDGLVERHLQRHERDAGKSLAALRSAVEVRGDLQAIADVDVQASLTQVTSDPYATRKTTVLSDPGPRGRYLRLRPYAKGGLGEVFVAEDLELHREVALKEILPEHSHDVASRGRFLLEAEITGGLEHPGIVPVHGLGEYRNNIMTLTQSCAGLGDQAATLRSAAKLRDLGWDSPGEAYDAARALALCIPIVEKDDRASKAEREKQAQLYADQAMAMLRDGIAKGYKDAAHMKKDTDLDPLRKREDFQKLLTDLEAKAKPEGK